MVTGYRLQVTGYRLQVQVTGYRLQVTGYRLQVTGYRVQGSRFKVQGSGFKVQGCGKEHRAWGTAPAIQIALDIFISCSARSFFRSSSLRHALCAPTCYLVTLFLSPFSGFWFRVSGFWFPVSCF